jgi:hypothetical protein
MASKIVPGTLSPSLGTRKRVLPAYSDDFLFQYFANLNLEQGPYLENDGFMEIVDLVSSRTSHCFVRNMF